MAGTLSEHIMLSAWHRNASNTMQPCHFDSCRGSHGADRARGKSNTVRPYSGSLCSPPGVLSVDPPLALPERLVLASLHLQPVQNRPQLMVHGMHTSIQPMHLQGSQFMLPTKLQKQLAAKLLQIGSASGGQHMHDAAASLLPSLAAGLLDTHWRSSSPWHHSRHSMR